MCMPCLVRSKKINLIIIDESFDSNLINEKTMNNIVENSQGIFF